MYGADTTRPGNTRNGFGGLTLSFFLGESFRKPVPGVAVSLCAGNGLSRFSGKGFRRSYIQPEEVPI